MTAAQELQEGKGASPTSRPVVGHDKLQFEEEVTFSDPIPVKASDLNVSSDSDEDGHQMKKNPFLDPDVAEHWRAVYEASRYECRHVFDPQLSWTEEEEKKLVRRLDWHVCLWAVSFFP